MVFLLPAMSTLFRIFVALPILPGGLIFLEMVFESAVQFVVFHECFGFVFLAVNDSFSLSSGDTLARSVLRIL